MSTKVYERLHHGQIRLLLLDPGSPSDTLSGRLEHVYLDQAIDNKGFEALSYTWGDMTLTGSIHLDDVALRLGSNAIDALANLRLNTGVRRIWIDSICINQADLDEKSKQVQLMASIYSAVWRVVVWLGPSLGFTRVGMAVLRSFASSRYNEDPPTHHDETVTWQDFPPGEVWSGLQELMHLPWWSRHWVVQEASLAKKVLLICGPDQVEWSSRCDHVVPFMRAIKLALVSPQWIRAGLGDVQVDPILDVLGMQLNSGAQQQIWSKLPKQVDFLEIVFSMRHRECASYKDKIYSLLGLGGEAAAKSIVPDYRKSEEEVYFDFAQFVARDTTRICRELVRLEEQHRDVKDEDSPELDVVSLATQDGQFHGLMVFMQSMCDKAMEETRNGNHAKAAKLLSDMALLLRGESHRN